MLVYGTATDTIGRVSLESALESSKHLRAYERSTLKNSRLFAGVPESRGVDAWLRSLYSARGFRSRRALMRTQRIGGGLFVCALLSAIYGVADAQTTRATAGAETSVGMQRQVNLTPREQLAQADSFIAQMGVTGSSVRRMLEQARAQRDVVKTLCLNDKLNQ